MPRIVLTGSGIVTALGIGKAANLEALQSQRSGIAEVQYLTTSHHELPVGEVKRSNQELQALVGVPSDGNGAPSRTALLGRLALREALQEAGLCQDGQREAGFCHNSVTDCEALQSIPLISGTTVGGMDRAEIDILRIDPDDGDTMMQAMLQSRSDCGTNTLEMASAFGTFAYVDTLSTACSSAANAVALAADLIQSGQYECVVAGGSEALSLLHFNGFNALMILDHEPCRPFDQTRAGLNLGEGAAYVVLESEEHALRRGATPLAVLSGYANACDAYHQTASSPEGEGAYLAMSQALRMAGLQPSDIAYVNCHGTGTPNNDPSELHAMRRLFGDATLPPYSSTKGFTGHTTSASGSIELVFCLLALRHHFLPVSLGCIQPLDPDFPPLMAKSLESTTSDSESITPHSESITPHSELSTNDSEFSRSSILCNAFGFGGNDTSIVLSSYQASDSESITNSSEPQAPDTESITNSSEPRPVYILAHRLLTAQDADPNFRDYMTPGDARRLGRMLKRTLVVSRQALQEGGIAQPDAIITGTKWGSMDSSRLFFTDMYHNGEQLLSPTHFMQSTHNTIGSLIAIQTRNHGYNCTHSQGDDSLRCALHDAWTQMQLGRIHSALVGLHDCLPELHNEAYLLCTADALPEGADPHDYAELIVE